MITFKEYLAEIAIKGKAVKGEFITLDDVEIYDLIKIKMNSLHEIEDHILEVVSIEDDFVQVKYIDSHELKEYGISKSFGNWWIGNYKNTIKSVKRV